MTDIANYDGEVQADLYYTPNKNLKFGIGYSWLRTTYFQQVTNGRVQSNSGTNHSVRFGGWFLLLTRIFLQGTSICGDGK